MAGPQHLRTIACVALSVAHAPFALAQEAPSTSATAALADRPFTFAMVETRFPIVEDWSLLAAVAYLDSGSAPAETQLRLGAVWATTIDTWRVESRSLLVLHSTSLERYRMRLRVIHPGLFDEQALSIRAFDELYFDFDGGRLFRNNAALGFGVQLTDALSCEIYQVWEGNRSRNDQQYVLAVLSMRFGRARTR